MVYSLEQIADYIKPIAEKYRIPQVYVFGSYARGDATEYSDIDLLVEIRGSLVRGIKIGGLYEAFEQTLPMDFDILTVGSLDSQLLFDRLPEIPATIKKDMIKIYDNSN